MMEASMNLKRLTRLALSGIALAACLGFSAAKQHSPKRAAPYRPEIDPAAFQATVDHPYFPLVPGTTFRFAVHEGAHVREDSVTVTRDVKTILGVPCVVVHDRVREKGTLEEDSFDWYAQDRQGNVWYMGEDTREFRGHRVSTAGSWEAGVRGAQPGIIMPAHPAPGTPPYRQEYSPGRAEDMGQIVALHDRAAVPYGAFEDCIRTREWSPLEAGVEKKWYAKGIGLVRVESTTGEVTTLIAMRRP
jgi:hypothetical protein